MPLAIFDQKAFVENAASQFMDARPDTQTTKANPAPPAEVVYRPPVTLRQGGSVSSNRDIAIVQADYLALANDLEQAQSLASELELQLSGKTNELAQFKMIWERTQADLTKLAHDLDSMRKERHALANEVQRAYAIQHKFERLTTAHDEMTRKVERLESELARERAAHERSILEMQQVQEKRVAVFPGTHSAPRSADDPELRSALEALRSQLDRVLNANPSPTPARPAPVKVAPERIDIEFGT